MIINIYVMHSKWFKLLYIIVYFLYMVVHMYFICRGVGSILKVGRPYMQGGSCAACVMASFASHKNVCVANITAYSEIVPVVIRNGSYYW